VARAYEEGIGKAASVIMKSRCETHRGPRTVERASEKHVEFTRHLEPVQAKLFAYLHSLVRDLEDAEDLFQQTCLILWRKYGEFDASRSFFSWACGVARLEAANFLRSRSRSRLYFSDDLNLLLLDAHEQLPRDELEERREALAGCVEKLRQRDRKLVEECYGDPSGVALVAQRLGRSPQSVHNSLRRIRRVLFECIHRSLALEMNR
jgi:RNA polymerase sigma-70 factor (ECF subfamily)